jgi:alpha-tubulin suppressor-like RCC1 family protein
MNSIIRRIIFALAFMSCPNWLHAIIVEAVTGDVTVDTRYRYILTLGATNGGHVTGAGMYISGDNAAVIATADYGYVFVGWNNDSSDNINPLILEITSDRNIQATFVPDLADSDSDGLSNYSEIIIHGSNPLVIDTDGDGLSDSLEVNTHKTSPIRADSDGDGVNDLREVTALRSNPLSKDTDGDGLDDGKEFDFYRTDPLKAEILNTTVVVWGDYNLKQTPLPPGPSGVVDVAIGYQHVLALRQDGTVVAWGDNSFGQCSIPTDLSKVIAISAGYRHSLALRQDGTVVAWGDNTSGQCSVPFGLAGVKAVAAGGIHSLALKNDGTVEAWGAFGGDAVKVPSDLQGVGSNGSYGHGPYGHGPFGQGAYGVVTAIAAGYEHSLALVKIGDNVMVRAWGDNKLKQCDVPTLASDVISISAGANHSMALTKGDQLYAWGDNEEQQVGPIVYPSNDKRVISIAAGWQHSLALSRTGVISGWGDNYFGQGNPPNGLDDGVIRVLAIAAGARNSVALVFDNRDSDGDGLLNVAERLVHGTDSTIFDSDGDDLGDGAELILHKTNPLKRDTDGDGIVDSLDLPKKPNDVPPITPNPDLPLITSNLDTQQLIVKKLARYAVTTNFGASTFSAKGLPPGLSIKKNTGVITGKPRKKGTYTVTITAQKKKGKKVINSATAKKVFKVV